MVDDDYMETGQGLIPIQNGWWLVEKTGQKISPEGIVYDKDMNKIGEVDFLTPHED